MVTCSAEVALTTIHQEGNTVPRKGIRFGWLYIFRAQSLPSDTRRRSIVLNNSVYVIIICILVIVSVIPTIINTIVFMVFAPLNKVGSMTHISQVNIGVNVYNFIDFSITIIKSFLWHDSMTFYKAYL